MDFFRTGNGSILFRPDNHPWQYLCECGEASDLTVKEIQNLHAIFMSHLHIDHFINFDKILRLQLGIGRKVVICGPKGIAKQVQSKIEALLKISKNATILIFMACTLSEIFPKTLSKTQSLFVPKIMHYLHFVTIRLSQR